MTAYNATVIQNIEETALQYIAIHKRMPSIIMISAYEYGEVKKALHCGVRPQIMFKGKMVTPNVDCFTKAPRDYDSQDFKQRGQHHEAVAKTETQA